MQVKDLMSEKPYYMSKKDSLQAVAEKMAELDCGFIPVGDDDRLDGVITDRDIVIRAVAKGKNLSAEKAGDYITRKVWYCFEDDSVDEAAKSMKNLQVYRLIVLNNKKNKRLRGVITLGDVSRHGKMDNLVGETSEEICKAA